MPKNYLKYKIVIFQSNLRRKENITQSLIQIFASNNFVKVKYRLLQNYQEPFLPLGKNSLDLENS